MGQSQTTSYAMVPFFTEGVFFGVLLVSQPAMNVETSVNSIVADLFKAFIIASIIAIIVSYFFATQQVKRKKRNHCIRSRLTLPHHIFRACFLLLLSGLQRLPLLVAD
jgi:hypothetical protein